MRNPARLRSAFTLYEVLISAALLGLVVVTALSMFPKAIETQKIARQKLYAATIAQELVTNHAEGSLGNFKLGVEDYHLARSANAPDLERLCFAGGGADLATLTSNIDDTSFTQRLFEPVPPAIIRRLDSDDHEIARLAEMGAGLFYMRNRAATTTTTATKESTQEALDTLVFGVVGYPQENAAYHAQTMWWTGKQDNYCRRNPFIGGSYRYRNNFRWPGGTTPSCFPQHSYFWESEALVLDSTLVQPPYPAAALGKTLSYFSAWPYQASIDVDTGLPVRREETNSLHMPFKPWERCRQLVFWSVDWKSYEDFETVAPLAPDSARFVVGDVPNDIIETAWSPPMTYEYDLGQPAAATATRWDRNFNGRADSGRIPAPVRLRAKTITRFNYYDKRLVATY